MTTEWHAFPKIPRLFRECVVTEKLDGSNASILVPDDEGMALRAFSRSREVTPGKQSDNHGFAQWVADNEPEIRNLGPGVHFGEWWGQGINRGYDLKEKRFSLFNVDRWSDEAGDRPLCCQVVPVILRETFRAGTASLARDMLRLDGSYAAPGYMKPEGIVVYHTAAKQMFKVTIENDEQPKGYS
jgi:hypothetical protein